MSAQRVWKIIKDLGKRVGVDTIHPHAFRHTCAVELLKRSGGNLRAVQEHLRHADIQTTTIYTRLAPHDLQKVVKPVRREERRCRALGVSIPPTTGRKSFAENLNEIEMVAPTGSAHDASFLLAIPIEAIALVT
jgi:hypothetical protein